MEIEVWIEFYEHDNDYVVNVWDVEENERAEDLERAFPNEDDCIKYMKELANSKEYIVHIKN